MIRYVEADLFAHLLDPSGKYKDKYVIVPHVCNNVRKWAAGFVVPLGAHFPEAKAAFMAEKNPQLGDVQFVHTKKPNSVTIANMFAQNGIRKTSSHAPPIRYDALQDCMTMVRRYVMAFQSRGHQVALVCPQFGSGLAGGDWGQIATMIREMWIDYDIPVVVCVLPRQETTGR